MGLLLLLLNWATAVPSEMHAQRGSYTWRTLAVVVNGLLWCSYHLDLAALREYYANRKKNALWNIGSVKQPARKPMARRRSAALQKLVGVGLIAPKAGGDTEVRFWEIIW
jgi:hypothetical protein